MGNLKGKIGSLKTALLMYLPVCLAVSYLGMKVISWASDHAARAYRSAYPVSAAEISGDKVVWERGGSALIYWLTENAAYILIPLWVVFCVLAAGYIFYSRELKEPIGILMDASKKIADNELDFHVKYERGNELGVLCGAFEEMRQKLFDSNLEVWRSIEERRRLSAAFSHDLRTPLTVLSGYVELMQNYGDKLSDEKRADIIRKMEQQITRLKHYTEKMNAVQKLEDISPAVSETKLSTVCAAVEETGRLVCGERFSLETRDGDMDVYIDSELLMQVYENLLSNAMRYAENRVTAIVRVADGRLYVSVCDDGKGFSLEALDKASKPFYRDEQNSDVHFGLGLYICRILCQKQGGDLHIENGENGGGKVTAEIFCEKLINS